MCVFNFDVLVVQKCFEGVLLLDELVCCIEGVELGWKVVFVWVEMDSDKVGWIFYILLLGQCCGELCWIDFYIGVFVGELCGEGFFNLMM